jgi:hypothetical protein
MALREASSVGVRTGSWRGCLFMCRRLNISCSRKVWVLEHIISEISLQSWNTNRNKTKELFTPTVHSATTCSMRFGPEGSWFSGKTSCYAFWFCRTTLCQQDTSFDVFSKATSLWICKRIFVKSSVVNRGLHSRLPFDGLTHSVYFLVRGVSRVLWLC